MLPWINILMQLSITFSVGEYEVTEDEAVHEDIHDLINDLEIPEEFRCPITNSLLTNPFKTTCCGRHLSQQALQKYYSRHLCPLCESQEFSALFDWPFQKCIIDLQVRCPYAERGCRWEGQVGELEAHKNSSSEYHKSLTKIVAIVPQEFSLKGILQSKHPWFSPSFYSHPGGYRMCLRLENTESGNLSIYLHLMKSANDSRLQFPFRGKVSTQLEMSRDTQENVVVFDDSISDVYSARVMDSERQKKGLRILHFTLEERQKYLSDDIRMIKIHVESKQVAVKSGESIFSN